MSHHRHTDPRLHINLRLERWHRRALYTVMTVLFGSGALWLIARYFLRQPGEFGETVHPIEPWAIKLHGAAAMAALFFAGTLLNGHIRRALKSRRNLASGWSMIAALALLLASGYGLYYLASEAGRPLWSSAHWIAGLVFGPLAVLHVVLGRRTRPNHNNH
ncbi:MAG TPA: DUF4405 domain-containing protein [Telluria sp.]|nr:DUF4405 domain-containing protein [Telluria sp.]